MRRVVALLALVVGVASCVHSAAVPCGGGVVCAPGKVCAVVDDVPLCVEQDQLDACTGVTDGETCTTDPSSTCHDGVCFPSACGNERKDVGEVCDDGDLTDGDGCSANCQSREVCGNQITDLLAEAPEACDDGGFLDHDGCSSTCQVEGRTWVPLTEPRPRYGAAAAYDAARGKVLLFGGRMGFFALTNATAEWDGVWRADIPTAPPPARSDPALAYDFERRGTVLYGGSSAGAIGGETWLWDGVAWRQLPSGPPRAGHAMAYDARRKRLVVFGGRDASGTLDTTLELVGDTWQIVTPVDKPGPREGAHMAYDAKRGVIVMVGGASNDPNGTVWEYDGMTWTSRIAAGETPIYRIGQSFTYDPATSRFVLFGGATASDPGVGDTWIFDGTTWTLFQGATPPGRIDAVLVPDGRGRLLLFGGRTSTSITSATILGDTWLFDGNEWRQAEAPVPRAFVASAAAYDHGTILHYGGQDDATLWSSDTWERTREGWKLVPTTLPVLSFARIAYDSLRAQYVLFGGMKADETFDNLTWLRSATDATWSSVQPTPSPPGRAAHAMVFDEARGELIVFGGFDPTNPDTPAVLADMWSWDGVAWTERSLTQLPTPRAAAAVGYDPVHQVVVMFGGVDADNEPVNETWLWDGTTWHDATPPLSPELVRHGTLAWNPARQSLVLAGPGFVFGTVDFETWEWVGTATSPPGGAWRRLATLTRPSQRQVNNTWPRLDGAGVEVSFGFTPSGMASDTLELVDRGPRSSDSCRNAIDVDGDGLAGCGDPDCWPVCSPRCPPGAPCPATLPRCGDGVCSAIETCQSCPVDCTTCAASACGDFICDPGESCLGDCP